MREDFSGGSRSEEVPVERQKTSDDIGGEGGDHAALFLFHRMKNFFLFCVNGMISARAAPFGDPSQP